MAGCASPKGVVTTMVGRLQRTGTPQILHNRNSFSTKWQCDFQNKSPLSTQPVGADYFFAHNTYSQCALPSSKCKQTASKKTVIFNNHPQSLFAYFFIKNTQFLPFFAKYHPNIPQNIPYYTPKTHILLL